MKNALIIALLCTSAFANAQSLSEFEEKSLAWLGVDFSLGKFVGKEGFQDLQKIKDHYFQEWNNLLVRESIQDVVKACKPTEFAVYMDNATSNNMEIDITEYVQDEMHRIKEQDVRDAVKTYEFGELEKDFGLVFFVEYFNKTINMASIYVAFLDIKTKKIFFMRKLDLMPSGFGFRNFWQGALKRGVAEIKGNMKKWKKGKK